MGFLNSSIKAPCPDKPHIVMIGGFWRCNPMPRRTANSDWNMQNASIWNKAFMWVAEANRRITEKHIVQKVKRF